MLLRSNPRLGFTLIELIMTIAIIVILAAVSIPSYLNHTKRTYYSEVVQSTSPFKIGVAQCYQNTSDLTQCNAGSNYVPAAMTTATGAITSIVVANGVIIVTPVAAHGILATDTYILTPTVMNNNITWTASGGGVTNGYAK